jgi:translocator protein
MLRPVLRVRARSARAALNFEGLDLKVIGAAAAVALVVALLGGLLTDLGPWYQKLKQPRWKPPDWAFGPIWTLIFAAATAAASIAWQLAPSEADRVLMVLLFAFNCLLNVAWSLLYFRFKRPDWALAELVLLWLSIVALIVTLAPYTPVSSWLLVPYLVWVTTAGLLNLATIRLNGPFGQR